MTEKFKPKIILGVHTSPPDIGEVIEIKDGKWIGSEFRPNGKAFEGSVIANGDTYTNICLSRSKENCMQCPYLQTFCEYPAK